jgi:hypothetical protein
VANTIKERLWAWLVLFSHVLNVLVFGGDPQESTSARAFREEMWVRRPIDWLFGLFGFEDHCREAHIDERIHARKVLGEYK